MPIFDQFSLSSFFWGCQKSALITILKTPGSISSNSWLRCYMLPHRLIINKKGRNVCWPHRSTANKNDVWTAAHLS